jgi:hypothetical protein
MKNHGGLEMFKKPSDDSSRSRVSLFRRAVLVAAFGASALAVAGGVSHSGSVAPNQPGASASNSRLEAGAVGAITDMAVRWQ